MVGNINRMLNNQLNAVFLCNAYYALAFPCSCQTYEGGIAGEPGSEAHGGYVSSHRHILSFCILYHPNVMVCYELKTNGC